MGTPAQFGDLRWGTSDGESKKLSELDDSHLINILNMAARNNRLEKLDPEVLQGLIEQLFVRGLDKDPRLKEFALPDSIRENDVPDVNPAELAVLNQILAKRKLVKGPTMTSLTFCWDKQQRATKLKGDEEQAAASLIEKDLLVQRDDYKKADNGSITVTGQYFAPTAKAKLVPEREKAKEEAAKIILEERRKDQEIREELDLDLSLELEDDL